MKGVFLLEKCECYHTQMKRKYLYDVYSGNCINWKDITIGVCWGTKECEICSCNGDKLKCDFYDYIREEAEKETLEYKIKEAKTLLEKNGYKIKKI